MLWSSGFFRLALTASLRNYPHSRLLVPEIACMASSNATNATNRLLLMWIPRVITEDPIKGCSVVELSNRAVSSKPMLRVLIRHRVGDRVEVQSFFPRQNSQPNRRAYDGVDEQDHQHRMEQPHPGQAWRLRT